MGFKGKFVFFTGSAVMAYATYKYFDNTRKRRMAADLTATPSLSWKPTHRNTTIHNMKTKFYDILVIGGGASGSGCALDAATRGLKVAMVESGDFGQETSSKSTKLLHGGVRYLEKATKTFDLSNFQLVVQALRERKFILDSVPYLARPIALMLPVYNRLMVPYFLLGLKMYDYVSWSRSIGPSHYISEQETMRHFPRIRRCGLRGSVVYYDGIHDDSRTNLMIALTAAYYNADVLNYSPMTRLVKCAGKVAGAVCRDEIGGAEFTVRAKCVISTVGPFTDSIMEMAAPGSKGLVVPSSGVHIVVPKEYGANNYGLINPDTSDNRVLFFIPWLNKTIIGCTDNPCRVEQTPKATAEEIDYVLKEANRFLKADAQLSRKDISSAWSGIRPLVKDPSCIKTKNVARNHIVHITKENLIVVAGGKWTTYRRMAEDAVNLAVRRLHLSPARPCISDHVKMLGSHGYGPGLSPAVQREMGLNEDEAEHFVSRYGDRTLIFHNYKENERPLRRLHRNYMYTKEEVHYSIDHEMACKPADVLVRRMRLGFLDVKASEEALDSVLKIFKKKMRWNEAKATRERTECLKTLDSLGLSILK